MFKPTPVPATAPRAVKADATAIHSDAVKRLNALTDPAEKAQLCATMRDWFQLQYDGFRLNAPPQSQSASA